MRKKRKMKNGKDQKYEVASRSGISRRLRIRGRTELRQRKKQTSMDKQQTFITR